ncbi:MAG TPA: GatB/YqeY domain-containing protein [Burkholderiaceae bacterium]|nr:GatB/YqeY domain-containing protein [Burkholderiaceae bacterium]
MEAPASLRERINEDMKAAMRAKDAPRLSAIRLLQAAIKQKEVDERITVDDTGVLGIVEKLIKQRKDSIEQFGKAGRTDLVAKEKAELDLLSMYLPQQMSEPELLAAVDAAIAEAGVAGPQAIGKVMALLKPRIAGRADMSQASALVKQRLS